MLRKNLYRDMEKFRRTRNLQKNRYYGKTSFKYERRPWTQKEDKIVVEHSMTDTEISKYICRSVRSIQVRRSRLKKIT